MSDVVLSPIADADVAEVAAFLHDELNPAVAVEAWRALLEPPWGDRGPDHGFQLRADGELVGAYCAVYSEREFGGATVPVCNLAAFCVRDDFRAHSLLLIRALLKRREYVFTDFSPSGNVVAMNERLGFRRLDTSTRLIVNLPGAHGRDIVVSEDPAVIAATLRGKDAVVFHDHERAAAAHHIVVRRGDEYAYLVFRADSRKRMRLFALPLYVGGDAELLDAAWGAVRARLLRHGLPFMLAERDIVPFARGLGLELRDPRPKMVRGDGLPAAEVDYLYSELALVSW